MARWAVFRATCLLATLATFVAANPVLMMRETPYHSIQILYGRRSHEDPNNKNEKTNQYIWSVWVGPQGVAVNLCEPGPFSFSRIAWAEGYAKDGDKILYREITDPRYPNEGSWSVVPWPGYIGQNGSRECIIKGKGEEGPAVLECGKAKTEFRKDAQFDDELMKCSENEEYHRAWTVEY